MTNQVSYEREPPKIENKVEKTMTKEERQQKLDDWEQMLANIEENKDL